MRISLFPVIVFSVFAWSCNDKSGPDVSGVKLNVRIERFEKDLFSLDTNKLAVSLQPLQQKYPGLLPVFLQNVIGAQDGGGFYPDRLKSYLALNRPIYDSVEKTFRSTGELERELELALRHVKYYFPSYNIPKVYTIVGPIDLLAQMPNGDYTPAFLGPDFLGISLQFYLGRNSSFYNHEYFITNVAPLYRSRRFAKEYIVADAMKLVVDDLFQERSVGRPLVEQMIEKGKQWWLLDKFMPDAPDSVKTGYTQKQLDWIERNEGDVWAYIVSREDLYSREPIVLQTYLGESPFTQGLPESSPGNIGQWIGREIVRKFAEKNQELSLQQLMQTDPKKILDEAKYKPK